MHRPMKVVLRCFFLHLLCIVRPTALSDKGACPKSIWPIGDRNRCTELMRLDKLGVRSDLGVIPGAGWDNLVNEVSGQVFKLTYAKCKMTDDGRLLVPDNVYTLPIKITRKESIGEVFSKWQDVTSSTSQSINLERGLAMKGVSVSGSFSAEKNEIRSKQIKNDGYIIRSQIRLHRYTVWLQPDSTFTPEFQMRLENIAANLRLNNTDMALFEAQLLVKDFGTHVITKVYAGAVLVKTDIVRRDYILSQKGESSKWTLGVAGGATLKKKMRIESKFEYSQGSGKEDIDEYEKNVVFNLTEALGGNQNLTHQPETLRVAEWLKGIDSNLVAIDRVGVPLHYLLTTKALPQVPATVIGKTAEAVRLAIEGYYQANSIAGCTDATAPNFDPDANVDDGNCSQSIMGFPFGGVYQTCVPSSQPDVSDLIEHCKGSEGLFDDNDCSEGKFQEEKLARDPCLNHQVMNVATKAYSCPVAFKAVPILEGSNAKRFKKKQCKDCYSPGSLIHGTKCCEDVPTVNEGKYVSYWCKPNAGAHNQVYFGGLFSSTTENPATKKQTCPYSFTSISFMNQTTICLSLNADASKNVAYPFGGFVSCGERRSNPLAEANRTCPKNFVEIKFDDEHCQYALCGPATRVLKAMSVKKPPFVQRPAETGASDYVWARTDNYEPAVMTPYEIAGFSLLSVLVAILCCVAFVKVLEKINNRRKWVRKRTKMSTKERTSESDSV